ncbi:MAG: hypothetical protein HY243_00830 [Proteobacteria bacterium]|nr:hypothetical protein [Pseudomonadota bacterium]
MSTASEKDFEALAAELKQLRADFAKLGELLESSARHAGSEALNKAKETGEKAWNETRQKSEDLLHLIEKRPLTSAASAFGIGLLLGMLMRGHRD